MKTNKVSVFLDSTITRQQELKKINQIICKYYPEAVLIINRYEY